MTSGHTIRFLPLSHPPTICDAASLTRTLTRCDALFHTMSSRYEDVSLALTLSLTAALCSTLGGTLATICGHNMPVERLAYSQAALGAALLFLGFCDLLPEAAAGISLARTVTFFICGALGSALASRLLRKRAMIVEDDGQRDTHDMLRAEVLVVGMITFVSMSVHNLLEGMSILFAVREGLERGVRLATAISLENVPEGVCIALPLYYATRKKGMAIRLAMISGLLEPMGVLMAGLFVNRMNQTSISSVLAVIAGILVFVALAEMLPLAVKMGGGKVSVWMGGGVLTATLFQPLLMYHGRVGMIK